MIALFLGALTFLFGAAIMANAAFTERGTFGFVIALIGGLTFGGGVIELVIPFFAP